MSLLLTVAATERLVSDLEVALVANGRGTARFTVPSPDGSLTINYDDEVIIERGGVRLFGGLVDGRTLKQHNDLGPPAYAWELDCVDFNALLDRRSISRTFSAGTLKSMLQIIEPYLTPYGVALDAGQVDGPAIDSITYADYVTLKQICDDLTKYSGGYVYEIDPYKKLSFRLPGTVPAPFDINDTLKNTFGDVTVTSSREKYANRIIGKCNAVSTGYTDDWTADEVVHGFTATAISAANPTHLTKTGHGLTSGQPVYIASSNCTPSIVGFWTVTVLDADHFTIPANVTGAGTSADVQTDWGSTDFYLENVPSTNTGFVTVNGVVLDMGANGWSMIESSVSPTGWILHSSTPQDFGTTVSFDYVGLGVGVVTAEDAVEIAAHGIWEFVVTIADGTSTAAAQALVDMILLVKTVVPDLIEYKSYAVDVLLPGMTQSVIRASRGLNNSFLLSEVNLRMIGEGSYIMEQTVRAAEGVNFPGTWRDTYDLWGGTAASSSGGGTSSGGGGGGGTVITNNQYYALGGAENVGKMTGAGLWVAATQLEFVVDTTLRGRTSGLAFVMLRADAGTVTARLRNLSDGVTVGTSVAVSGAAFQLVLFPVTFTAGSKRYRLEISSSLDDTEVAGMGYLE